MKLNLGEYEVLLEISARRSLVIEILPLADSERSRQSIVKTLLNVPRLRLAVWKFRCSLAGVATFFFNSQWSTKMQTDEKRNDSVPCEDALVAIGDMAICGSRLQAVLATGIVSGRIVGVCEDLFTEIAELADLVDQDR